MELSRRDAIAALAATGVAIGGGITLLDSREDQHERVGEGQVKTAIAAAEVLYPSEITEIETFVSTFVEGRAARHPDHAEGMAEALAFLDRYAQSWYDQRFASLTSDTRHSVLQDMGADTVDPDPEGTDVERVRYYVVNELLFALYTSPTGGRLVGLENPQGYPGGLASYTRGSEP